MGNLIEQLRKENNGNDKLLTKENNLIMTDMIVYLRSSNLCDYDIEVIRRELFGMVYEAQMRNETIDQVIGDDYKEFCKELMENGRQKTSYERLLESAYIAVAGIGFLFLIELFFSGTLLHSFSRGDFTMDISMGFIAASMMILAASLLVYWFFTKYSFELSGACSFRYKFLFVACFTVFFTGVVLINHILGERILFQVNYIYPALILAIAYLTVKMLGDKNANRLAQAHK